MAQMLPNNIYSVQIDGGYLKMEFRNYEFESFQVISEIKKESLHEEHTFNPNPDCQLMLHEFGQDQPIEEYVPIGIIQSCLMHMEK